MATTVGLMHLEFRLPGAASLKDKRRAIKSFKDRMTAGYNVSVAEVGGQDNRRSGTLAVAMVGSDRRYVEGALQRIANAAANQREMLLLDTDVQWL